MGSAQKRSEEADRWCENSTESAALAGGDSIAFMTRVAEVARRRISRCRTMVRVLGSTETRCWAGKTNEAVAFWPP